MPSVALFEILVRENADSLTVFLRAAIDVSATADDFFQETMLIAWRKIGDYDRARPFGAWWCGLARNLVLTHYRLAARQIAFSNEKRLELLDQRVSQIERRPGDSFDEKIAALTDCIERLTPKFRGPIDLHYRESRNAEWIARHLETTKDAIQKRLQRARIQLAECLEQRSVLTKLAKQHE